MAVNVLRIKNVSMCVRARAPVIHVAIDVCTDTLKKCVKDSSFYIAVIEEALNVSHYRILFRAIGCTSMQIFVHGILVTMCANMNITM